MKYSSIKTLISADKVFKYGDPVMNAPYPYVATRCLFFTISWPFHLYLKYSIFHLFIKS